MGEDWLDTGDERKTEVAPPSVPAELPVDPRARLALVQECWAKLNDSQRKFLTAYRDSGLNGRRTNQNLTGRYQTPTAHTGWMRDNPYYATIVKIWRGITGSEALDKDRLLARQDDIVEMALTPRPVLHEGIMVLDTRPGAPPGAVLEEFDAGVASRANEVLMKAAGLFPKEDATAIGVQVQLPQITVELTPKSTRDVIDAPCVEVDTSVPSEDWLS